jgi:hypothetical protein
LQVLEGELHEYERSAREFDATIADIVRHHYQSRKQRALAALDQELKVESLRVTQAREAAIVRLTAFIRQYSGAKADPVATPDALYRLAALYEERARTDDADLATALKPAIALYRRILNDFPNYEQRMGAHYYLGHALTDAGRIEDGQQVWRSLVCANHYQVKADANDAQLFQIQGLTQDHGATYWDDWAIANPVPVSTTGRMSKRASQALLDRELIFRNPYQDCQPLTGPANDELGPRYVAETWWQIGNYHFDGLDHFAGPYALNRAVAAYERSLLNKRPPLQGVAMYKHAWALYRQQRYHAAVLQLVELLRYADEQQRLTGDEGTDFRTEAYGYVAAALTYQDFEGPTPDQPYLDRGDALDSETNPLVAEKRMAIAVDRVQDSSLIPQDQPWSAQIYDALADELIELTQTRNAVAVLELATSKFPLNRDAPKMQNRAADLYEQLSRLAPEQSSLREEYRNKALDARTALARFVGATEWTRAHRKDPEALAMAAKLVSRGMQRVAAERTNTARAQYAKAIQTGALAEQASSFERSLAEYRAAATSWAAYLAQDPEAVDSYESRFWLADARFWTVVLQLKLGRAPDGAEIQAARQAARAVRDSNDDHKYLQPAAFYLVTLADQLLDARYKEFQDSGGTLGIAQRTQLEFRGEGLGRRVKQLKLPPEVKQAIVARDEYNQRVPDQEDPQHNGLLYAFQAADFSFVYGQFGDARRRLEPLLAANCGKNVWGFRAWEKLISMSNFEGDAQRSRALADKSCSFDDDTRAAEDAIRKPVRQGAAYLEARQLYERAEQAPPEADRNALWRKAAAAYKAALDAAPDRDEAPEAAMNGAFAYKQVGEYSKAIEMYSLFIARYGSAEKLRTLREGDPNARPPKAAEPERFENRVKFLKLAYDALANAYLLFFDYPKAAETLSTVANGEHFSAAERRAAAEQALNLYASLGKQTDTLRSRDLMIALGASPQERASANFVIASAVLQRWDAASPDAGGNRQARQQAEQQLRGYYDAHVQDQAALEYLVEACYWLAKLKGAAKDPSAAQWWTRTQELFAALRDTANKDAQGNSTALGSRQAGFAAEGAFLQLDDEIKRSFDYDSGFQRFKGTPEQVIEGYQRAAVNAKSWYDRLQRVIDDYASPEWATAALARQGSLYDSLRTGLYNLRTPELQMFDQKTEALLQRAENSDNPALQEKADAIRTSIESSWRTRRDEELDSADRIVVDRYARAVVWAKRYNVSSPVVAKAISRLAFLTDVLGEARMQQYATTVPELGYKEGAFLRMRPGLVVTPPVSGQSVVFPPRVQP